ncbi:hypothetical protein [Pinirhizobacter sp.]|jgi:hypothetical protein|uniref:hypothetical protein n=1 Tax=Pinirhizobacter sp. TaxID=2950432 RepID=UPI002F3EE1CB
MNRYPDAYLDHWSDIYVARQIRSHGITLDQFLVHPEQILARVDRTQVSHSRDSEPVQHRCDRRAIAALYMRGEILIQKFWRGRRHGRRHDVPKSARK